jgi:predicted aspartyl protease
MSAMGTFRTTIRIENHLSRGPTVSVPEALVDTGSELTWVPAELLQELGIQFEYSTRFITATGERVERDVGYAIVHAEEARTIDEVVFAQPGDMTVLGARSLEGLNLRVDSRNKRLVPAGPLLAGAIW